MSAEIPMLDLARLHATIRPELDDVFDAALRDSTFVGPGEEFEWAFAAAHGLAAAAGCGSGTDALVLALLALGVGPGHEVIVPAMTFVATAEAVVLAGATPVLADVDPETLLLTAADVERVHTGATRAVIPVHLYGAMVDPNDLRAMGDGGLLVVEDASQAHTASRDGHGVGTVGACATFSFHPGKNLGALGDGGAVASQDRGLVERVRSLRDHGRAAKHGHDVIGRCSRLDALQAAVLEVKLRHLGEWTRLRRQHAAHYRERLGRMVMPSHEGAVHHQVVLRAVVGRDRLTDALRAASIGFGIHYPYALSQLPALAPWARPCPAAERGAAEVLSLPLDPLMSAADVDQVCDVVEKAAR